MSDHENVVKFRRRDGAEDRRDQQDDGTQSSDNHTPHDLTDAEPNDTGNAVQFARRNVEDVRYCHDTRRWLTWRGHHWAEDRRAEVKRRMTQTLCELLALARQTRPPDDPLTMHYERSLNAGRIDAALKIAATVRDIACTSLDFDTNPWLLGVSNGVIDLKAGTFRSGQRGDMITLASPIEYDPWADCPRFRAFMSEVYEADPEKIDFMQRWLGYCLTGTTIEELMAVLYGYGSNGKSVLLEIVRHILGPLAGTLPPGALDRRSQRHGLQFVAACRGKRLMTLSEVSDDSEFNEQFVKALTSRDALSGRRLYHNLVEFIPSHKVTLALNHLPTVRDATDGMWRRLAVIAHGKTFPPDEALPAILRNEAPGILNLMIEGCRLWQKRGLKPLPPTIKTEVDAYRYGSNTVQQFLDAACECGDDKMRLQRSALFNGYRQWCRDNGITSTLGRNVFIEEMRRRFEEVKSTGQDYFCGVKLRGKGS